MRLSPINSNKTKEDSLFYAMVDNQYKISTHIAQSAIHIQADNELHRMMKDKPYTYTEELVRLVKEEFLKRNHRAIQITTRSFVIEIWGHYYAQQILYFFKNKKGISLTRKIYERLMRSTSSIDCGEKWSDSNRFLWDLLAPLKSFFGLFVKRWR